LPRKGNGIRDVVFRNPQIFELSAYPFGGMQLHGSKDDFPVSGVNVEILHFSYLVQDGFGQGKLIFAGHFGEHGISLSGKDSFYSHSKEFCNSVKANPSVKSDSPGSYRSDNTC
jgi:hypothetical protein